MSDFWSDPSSTFIFHVSEQRRLWQDWLRGCAGSPEPSLVAYVISIIISWAGSNIMNLPLDHIAPTPQKVRIRFSETKNVFVVSSPRRCTFWIFWEQSCAQPGTRRPKGCHISHYLSWADLIKLSMLFLIGCCISKGSLSGLFRDHNSCCCVMWRS